MCRHHAFRCILFRCFAFAVALIMFSVCSAFAMTPDTTGTGLNLEKYLEKPITIQGLLDAAEKELQDGIGEEQVRQELIALADNFEVLDLLNCAIENRAAADISETYAVKSILDRNGGSRKLSLDSRNEYEYNRSMALSVYDTPSISDKLLSAIKGKNSQACLEPAVWRESDFNTAFGKTFKKFKPAEPRPGYVCIVVPDDAESEPETKWYGGDTGKILETLTDTINDLRSYLGEEGPVITGNPQLASTFWVFDLKFPFYSYYGTNREIKGYHCTVTLTVMGASDHKKIASFSCQSILPDSISKSIVNNGIAHANIPTLRTEDGYQDKLAQKILLAVQKERATALASRQITVLNVEKILNALLLQQTNGIKDGWQKAIYESGAQEINLNGDTLAFRLRSYDPLLSELGSYAGTDSSNGWLTAALNNISAYNLPIVLELENGTVPTKSIKSMKTAVQKAAGNAKKAIGGKDFSSALTDYLFPTPVSGKIQGAYDLMYPTNQFIAWYEKHSSILNDAPAEVAGAVFSVQNSQKLAVKDGPHALTLTCVGASLVDLLTNSINELADEQAHIPASGRITSDTAEKELMMTLLKNAAAAAGKKGNKTILTLDVDDLLSANIPGEYRKYFAAFNWYGGIDSLTDTLRNLSDSPVRNYPKTGVLSGENQGTKVIFKPGDLKDPYYVVLRNRNTGRIVATAFAESKKSMTVRVPQGYYDIIWCTGRYWYGTDELFGSTGSYSKIENFEVWSKKYYHTLIMATDKGNLHGSDASPEDFK